MRKLLLIFALLIASCDEKEQCPHSPVTISDALPIQFWLSDCDTYNEKEVCGVHRKCWCHPWLCDKEIQIQVLDDAGELNSYTAKVFDSEGNELHSFALETAFSSLFLQNLSDGVDDDFEPDSASHQPWSVGIAPNISIASPSGASAYFLLKIYGAKADTDYNFDYSILRGISGTGVINLYIVDQAYYNAGGVGSPLASQSLSLTNGTFVETGTFEYSGDSNIPAYIMVEVFNTSGVTSAQINSLTLQEGASDFRVFHFGSFVPQDEGICDEEIMIRIYDSTSPETEVAKSECIDVRTTFDCTTSIDYSNNRNFAGLIYEAETSPEQSFTILVPAIFFHERFPEEDNAMELTSGIVKTSGVVKAQTLFETDYMPYYMHKKLKLIFKHQTITINDQNWIKEEAYEISEGDRRWPVKKAKCFLTESNFVQRAVL